MNWVTCSFQPFVGKQLHTVLVLPAHCIANVAQSNLEQVLAEAKHGCAAQFSLLLPNSLLHTKGVLAALGGSKSTKVLGTEPSYWELTCGGLSDGF